MIEDRIEVNIAGGLDIALPAMAGVRQKFTTTRVDDIAAAVAREFERPDIELEHQARRAHRRWLRQPRRGEL